jgi:hypothetical protein
MVSPGLGVTSPELDRSTVEEIEEADETSNHRWHAMLFGAAPV